MPRPLLRLRLSLEDTVMKVKKPGARQTVREPAVKRAVEMYMDRRSYRKVDSRERHETGIDLTFKHRGGGRHLYVEAKGDSSAKSGMENKLIAGLGQIVAKFKRSHENHRFALAVPEHWRKRAQLKLSPAAMKAPNLEPIFVDGSGRVGRLGRQAKKT